MVRDFLKVAAVALIGYLAGHLYSCTKISTDPNRPSGNIIATVEAEYGCLANLEILTTNCDDYGLTLSYEGNTCDVKVFRGGGLQPYLLPLAKRIQKGTVLEIEDIDCEKGKLESGDFDIYTQQPEVTQTK